jgi:uncharacterized protein (TIGR02246 family)
MIGRTTTVLVIGALALAGCNKAVESKVDTAAIEKQIRDNEAKWMAAYNSHDAAALASNYAEDAVLANPDTPLVSGLDAIRKETAGFAADPNLKIDFSSDRVGVAASGDLAYSRGHYSMTYTDPDTKKPADSTGHYLTVYRKQADGSWKAVEDFVTQGPQAEAN